MCWESANDRYRWTQTPWDEPCKTCGNTPQGVSPNNKKARQEHPNHYQAPKRNLPNNPQQRNREKTTRWFDG